MAKNLTTGERAKASAAGLWGMVPDDAPGWAIDVADKQAHGDECATFVLAVNRAPIFRNGLHEDDRRMADQLVRDGVIARRAANWQGELEYIGIALCPVDGDTLIDGNCPTCARRAAKAQAVKVIPGIQYTLNRFPDEQGEYARKDSYLVQSEADSEGVHTVMRASGPLHGQRFRADAAFFAGCVSVYDCRYRDSDNNLIGARKTAREIAAEVGCAPEMVYGAAEEIAAPPPAEVVPDLPPAAIRCVPCGGWGRWDDVICTRCDGSGVRPGALDVIHPSPAHAIGVEIHAENLAACLGTSDTLTAKASERLVLVRFLDYLERNGIVLGEYGKSEGGGSPLTPVESATETLEAYLRPIRRSVAR